MITVKALSQLAGITVRTLHYYDSIDLLKPSRTNDSGYRQYGEEAVFRLQQILFYKELGLPLEKIKRLLGRPEFDLLEALEQHKREIQKRVKRLEELTKTVDQTILHIEGKKKMSSQEIFTGFTPEQEEAYTQEAMEMYDPETVKASQKRWKGYSKEKQAQILAEGQALYTEWARVLPLGAGSPEAQDLVKRWRQNIEYFWTPQVEHLVSLAQTYLDDPRFKANFDKIDPKLAQFIGESVRAYVESLQA